MTLFWKNDTLHVLKCVNGGCGFMCLDPETWEPLPSGTDYYDQIHANDVNPARSFIKSACKHYRKVLLTGGQAGGIRMWSWGDRGGAFEERL